MAAKRAKCAMCGKWTPLSHKNAIVMDRVTKTRVCSNKCQAAYDKEMCEYEESARDVWHPGHPSNWPSD